MLTLDALSYRYGRGPRVLMDVSSSLASPVVAILGPNGAGKSTLLRLLTTAAAPQEGSFSVGGWSSTDRSGLRGYRRRLGVMPQGLRIFGGYSCLEFLNYVAWLREVPVRDSAQQVEDALRTVDLWERRDQPARRLSGGMRQRLGLAQALVNRPSVLLLDEPTVGLDPRQRSEFREYIRRLQPQTLVVLATHLVDDVAAIASEVLVLEKGFVRFSGTIETLCARAPSEQAIVGSDVEAAYMRLVGSER